MTVNTKINQKMSKSILIVAVLCLVAKAACAATPPEFTFNVVHFSVEGLPPLAKSLTDDYFRPLQNRPYTLKELQHVSSTFERIIHQQGYPFYRVTVPPQSLASGDIRLQVISTDALHCNASAQ